MKNSYFIRNLAAIFLCLSFSLQSMEEENKELQKGIKRTFSETQVPVLSEEKKPSRIKKPRLDSSSGSLHDTLVESSSQIYSIPTYDATFKYMLSDTNICLSFLRTFALTTPHIQEITRLDEHLRPIQDYQVSQLHINDPRSKSLMKRIAGIVKDKGEESGLDVVYTGARNKTKSIANGGWFISGLAKIYGDILKSYPTPERNSTVDVLCLLDTGSYALVEVQVVEQDYWDRRALAYAASVYSRQMKRSDKWDKLEKVICINILGGGLKSVKWDTVRGFKHYKFKDQDNTSIDGGIEILQYPLYHKNTVEEAFEEVGDDDQRRIALIEWMDFLEHASSKREADVMQIKTEGLKEAYEKVKSEKLPKEVKEANERQDEEVFKRSERVIAQKEQKAREEGEQLGLEKGKEEQKNIIALNMLQAGVDIDQVSKYTDLSKEQVEILKQSITQ